ncbi:SDR family oxidoreductase [Halolamina litorea]|uniref:SDR family NAD(P)-dependent oxidoreductase n=1 Tax=Halolamina litorea TaxID=1515593 RepID=A0ABD6BWP1_9EURY|nr:glucose 1-dehydrogenase [Halolamina litorea]
MSLLDGRTAVVTGGASGIGRGIALAFADHGADVVVADLRERPRRGGDPTHEAARERGVEARYVDCDVSDPADVDRVFAAAAALGGLDVWVNNAGVFATTDPTEPAEAADGDAAAVSGVFDVNVRGTYDCTARAGRRIAEAGGGSVINVGSTSGIRGGADGAIAAYCASKAAIHQLTRSFARAFGDAGVRVNAVAPGAVDTALARDRTESELAALEAEVPVGRIGHPDDVAGACVFLASGLAAYVSGEVLVVDGGLTV